LLVTFDEDSDHVVLCISRAVTAHTLDPQFLFSQRLSAPVCKRGTARGTGQASAPWGARSTQLASATPRTAGIWRSPTRRR